MSFLPGATERAEYEKIHYPAKTDRPDEERVLRNRLDIRDPVLLQDAERHLNAERLRQGLPAEARQLNYRGFKAIHRHLFQDIYDWAGEERRYTTGRSDAPFARPDYIAPWMEKRFAILKAEKNLTHLKPGDFAGRAAEHVNEINAAHPFVEGNGRTQRAWLRVLADKAGFKLTLSDQDRGQWYEASRIGFEKSDHQPMASLIADRITKNPRSLVRRSDGRGR